MDTGPLLLRAAFRNVISEPTIEAGFERFCAVAERPMDFDAFRDAVVAALRDGLVREPIRLPDGALQCHWHLELTPKGVAAARALIQHTPSPPPDLPLSRAAGEGEEGGGEGR